MANVLVEETSLQDIADAIREKTETEDTFKPSEMGEAIRGISSGDSYYDTFWDEFQQNGERTEYAWAFYGSAWTDRVFKPKYDIKPTKSYANYLFNYASVTDLTQILKDCEVTLDTSECTQLLNAFGGSKLTHIPAISLAKCVTATSLSSVFYICYDLVRIEKLISNKDTQWYNNMFNGCWVLEHCPVEGEIGKSITINQPSKLNNESAKSILTCLVNYTGTDNEFANTVQFHADVWTRLDAEGETSPTGTTWKKYVEDKGWLY